MSRRSSAPKAPASPPRDPPDLEILPLTPDRLADLAQLFGQGGDPNWCWCAFYRVRGMSWSNSTPAKNRAVLTRAVEDGDRRGRAPGLVAYRDREAVGWVSFAPREDFERLEHSTVLKRVDDRPVWSIVCFVVGRTVRRQGVADALLATAVDYARDHGATMLEAYPVDTGGERVASANLYHGTLSMFERAGFRVVDRRRATAATTERPIVRRGLRRATTRARPTSG
jgi:GNAT superfamily N-acetyltransferase